MKVLVCGGSSFQDKALLYEQLDALHADTPISLVINGGARGADQLASSWAKERGVELRVYRADWNLGAERFVRLNAEMLRTCPPDLVLAFPGGAVTADMVARAGEAGINIDIVERR